jgi:hypothetical protein
MSAIRIRKKIESETLHVPELRDFVGRTVEIVVLDEPRRGPASEKDWEQFLASAGPDLIDPEIYRAYREFDCRYALPPEL